MIFVIHSIGGRLMMEKYHLNIPLIYTSSTPFNKFCSENQHRQSTSVKHFLSYIYADTSTLDTLKIAPRNDFVISLTPLVYIEIFNRVNVKCLDSINSRVPSEVCSNSRSIHLRYFSNWETGSWKKGNKTEPASMLPAALLFPPFCPWSETWYMTSLGCIQLHMISSTVGQACAFHSRREGGENVIL